MTVLSIANFRLPLLVLIGVVACSTPPTVVDAQATDAPADEVATPTDESDFDPTPDLQLDPDDVDQSDEGTVVDAVDESTPVDAEPDPDLEPDVTRSPCLSYMQPSASGSLPPEVNEASGMAVVDGESTVLWLHNDSGDSARLYAVDPEEGLLATVTLMSTSAIDWEDMARGPCAPGDATNGCLYVGDIGDNYAIRPWVVVYRIPIPDAQSGDIDLFTYELMSLRYPDGSRDAEALVVDRQANVFLLTKERDQEGTFKVYSTPFEAGGRRVELTDHGTVDFSSLDGSSSDLVTAADYDSVRRRVLVRTYNAAIEFRLPARTSIADLPSVPFVRVPIVDERQGESIAYGQEGYWHVSEGNEPPIYFVGCNN